MCICHSNDGRLKKGEKTTRKTMPLLRNLLRLQYGKTEFPGTSKKKYQKTQIFVKSCSLVSEL